MTDLQLKPNTTALVLIDLQHGIMGMPMAPHAARDILQRCSELAAAFRAARGTVAYVRVDITQILPLPVDASMHDPNAPPPPAMASQIMAESGVQDGDLLITKRQWGAFYGTDLDQQLRRRGISTIVLGGVATNFGVESTARTAFDLGYQLVFPADAMSSVSAAAHDFALQHIFPRIGRVRSSAALLDALSR